MLFVTLFLEFFASLFRSTDERLTVTSDRINKVLKTCGATQIVVLEKSKAFYRVWHTGVLYKFRLYCILKRCFILLIHFVELKDFQLF